MKIDQVSAVILTLNEEENIERVLNSLTWLKYVHVVDSGSTDETRNICNKFTNVFFHLRKFDYHAAQWNYGMDCVSTPWVLTLDADHVLDENWPEMWNRCDGSQDGYLVQFRYVVDGRPLKSCLYPPKVVLFRKTCGHFVQDGHTQRLILKGRVGFFPAKIFHDDRKKMLRWVTNQLKYAELEAEKIVSESKLNNIDKLRRTTWLMPILIMPFCLFKCGLVFEGRRGWIYTLQRLFAETLIALMILEKKSHEKFLLKNSRD